MRALVSILFMATPLILSWVQVAQAAICAPPSILAGSGEEPTVARSVEDPVLGTTWKLVRDCAHPGGPGRLIINRQSAYVTDIVTNKMPFVIRVGDTLTLIEETQIVHLALQAVALESGAKGRRIRVRLINGGSVVSALVLAAGQVALLPRIVPFEKTNGRLP